MTSIDLGGWLTAAVGVATVVQAVVAVAMLKGLKHARTQAEGATKALDLAKSTAERQLRAYVSLESCEIIPGAAGKPLPIKCLIVNTGQTPARDFKVQVSWTITAPEKFDGWQPEAPTIWESNGHLGAGLRSTFLMTIPSEVVAGTRGDIANGAVILGVVGEVRYLDIYDNQRVMTFRRRLRPDAHPTHLTPAGGDRSD